MSKIALRKNVMIVNADLSTGNVFQRSLYIEFIPDEVVVRKIHYYEGNSNGIHLLTSTLANDFVAVFNEYTGVCSDLPTYTIQKPIQGSYEFKLTNLDDTIAGIDGQIAIHLEFIQYAK